VLPEVAGGSPPTVFTRWMNVTRWKIPGPELDTAVSDSQGIAVALAVHRSETAPTTLLPLTLSHVGPA
jgi:hypothetical protein